VKSSNLRLNKRRRTFVRLLGEIQHSLLEALDEEYRSRGLTRAEIARAIGRNRSFVTRKLNGQSNMTLESLADLAFALDRPVKVSLPSRKAATGSNRVDPSTSPTPRSTIGSGDVTAIAA
jgi:transcriptional regulator with XRE-family HTH domain